MRLVFLCICIVFLSSCTEPEIVIPKPVTPPSSSINISPQNSVIKRGQPANHKFFVKVEDPDLSVTQAVIFLNVLYTEPGSDRIGEKMLPYFENGSITNPIFNRVLTGEQIRKGLATQLFYSIRADAPTGQYTINVQVFNGGETNPNLVNYDNLIGIYNLIFEVE